MKVLLLMSLIATFLTSTTVLADDTENRLYSSCMTASKDQGIKAQTMCQCQAKKWASGQIQSPQDPSRKLDIKNEYIQNLITDWNHNIGFKNGASLQGENAEQAVIAMNIGFACAKELGELKNEQKDTNAAVNLPSSETQGSSLAQIVQSAKIVKKDFQADLKIVGNEAQGRIGVAKWKEYADGKKKFTVTVNKKAEELADPLSVELNGQLLGNASRKTVQAAEKEHVFYNFQLQSDECAAVPAVKEGDTVTLKTADGQEIVGSFVPD